MKIGKITQKFTQQNVSKLSNISSSNFSSSNSNFFDASLSGSTCSLVLFYKNNIYSLSLGDSKGILGALHPYKSSYALLPYTISTEHNTSLKSEQNRILASNGFLHPIKDKQGNQIGPLRIWNSGNKYPGLMVSRSFGDLIGKNCGVSGEPDIIELEMKEKFKCLILASDGFWDMHSNLDALQGVLFPEKRKMRDIQQVLVEMTQKTLLRWKMKFGNSHRDDVSILSLIHI